QAEDGIRDFHVTGVQTCALPISVESGSPNVAGVERHFAFETRLFVGVVQDAATFRLRFQIANTHQPMVSPADAEGRSYIEREAYRDVAEGGCAYLRAVHRIMAIRIVAVQHQVGQVFG